MAQILGSRDSPIRSATSGKSQHSNSLLILNKKLSVVYRKKMNFTTELPKKNPIVSYIVASAVKCEKFFPDSADEGPVFRMHAVILTKKSSSNLIQDSLDISGNTPAR